MSYEPTVWDENTPITPARLNNLESQYLKAVADAKVIKSIQTGEDSLSSGNGSKYITINPVDITKSICFIGSKTTSGADIDSQNVAIYLKNSTTIDMGREATTGNVFVNWYVIEFY